MTATGTRLRLRAGLRFARSLSKGLCRGAFFPRAGRAAPGLAPGGTDDPGLGPGPFQGRLRARLQGELHTFTLSQHRLTIPSLTAPIEILHLTDVHLRGMETERERTWFAALEEVLAPLAPDLVCITGDVVTKGWTQEAVAQFLDALPNARLGRFAVMGNWEHWAGATPELWAPLLARHGVTLLRDTFVEIGEIVLAGTEDALSAEPDLRACMSGWAPGKPAVVMTHSPVLFPACCRPGTHLVLSGHSHAGQVRVPFLGATWVPMGTGGYVGGWYRRGEAHLYVSRGVGWSIAPLRAWCPPEVALIRLEP